MAYGPANLALMMWWGFGGYAKAIPSHLQSTVVQAAVYLSIQFIVIYVVLFAARPFVRIGALMSYLIPWVLVIIIALGGGGGSDFGALILMTCCVGLIHFPGEVVAKYLRAMFLRSEPPNPTAKTDARESGARGLP